MKKITLIAFMLLSVLFSYAQNNLSVSFKDSNLKEVIKTLENKTNLKFYYMDSWLDDKKFTKDYNDASLTSILEDILKESSINFTLFENKVLLVNITLFIQKYQKAFLNLKKTLLFRKMKLYFIMNMRIKI